MKSDFVDKILSYEEWRQRPKTSRPSLSQFFRKQPQTAREPEYRPKHQHDIKPDHVLFTMDINDMDKKIEHEAAGLIALLGRQEYKEIEEIRAFIEKLLQLKPGPEKPDWAYALIGNHGEGKSLLINCLNDRYNLAGVSGGTKSCTQFATEYRHKPGAPDNANKSDVTIAFFHDNKLKENTEEYVRRYSRVHHTTNEDEESDDESVEPAPMKMITRAEENLSKEAYDVFYTIVNGDKQGEEQLNKYLKCAERFIDGTLVEFLFHKQRERLRALDVDDKNTVTYSDVPDKLGPKHEQGDKDIATVRKIAESLGPLVNTVTVTTGGVLLRYGLVLVDIPGYRDLNQTRIASANRHRRSAHGEIIVTAARRIEDSEDLESQVLQSIKAHGDRNTVLVMNRIDEAFSQPGHEAVSNEISANEESPFRELANILRALEDVPDVDDDYVDYLIRIAQCAMQRQNARPTEEKLKQRYGGRIGVFSVVASSFHDWLNEHRAQDPVWGPRMSGVPHLRCELLRLTAEQKLQIYQRHYFDVLPSVVDDIQRILTKTMCETNVISSCRRSLEQCFQNTIQDVRAAKEINEISIVVPIYRQAEKTAITTRIKALISTWSNSKFVRFQTFLHTLVHKGIPHSYASKSYRGRDINWNRDILETMERPARKTHAYTSPVAHLSAWENAMLGKVPEIANSITGPISAVWDLIEDIIVKSSAPLALKERMREAWKKIETNLRDIVNQFQDTINNVIKGVHREVTTEEDIGCMIARMNWGIYQNAEYQPRGKGAYMRQRLSVIESFCSPDSNGKTFVDRYEAAAKWAMTKGIAQASEQFITAVNDKLAEFIRITHQFLQTDVYKTSQHLAARKILEDWLPGFQARLLECQQQFPGHQFQQDVQFIGSIKRSNRSESESPKKRIKEESCEDDSEDDGSEGDGSEDDGSKDDGSEDFKASNAWWDGAPEASALDVDGEGMVGMKHGEEHGRNKLPGLYKVADGAETCGNTLDDGSLLKKEPDA